MNSKTIKLGLDLDGILVNHPPLIPKGIIEWLYKKKNNGLSYRFPGRFEQKIRILSHAPSLRPVIKTNLSSLSAISKNERADLFLVSSRFSFLKERTDLWDKKHGIYKYFKKIFFNLKDEQPHIFKDKIIKKERIEKFIDDDLDLLNYLSKKNPDVKFYWINSGKNIKTMYKKITKIKDLEEFRKKHL